MRTVGAAVSELLAEACIAGGILPSELWEAREAGVELLAEVCVAGGLVVSELSRVGRAKLRAGLEG